MLNIKSILNSLENFDGEIYAKYGKLPLKIELIIIGGASIL